MSNADSALPAAAAALSEEDRADLVNALKNKLQSLAGKHSNIIETLPDNVRNRVEFLKEVQKQHDELEAKFIEEKRALEVKYQKLYEPLYTQRFEIVNGVKEVEGITTDVATDQGDKAAEVISGEKGVPDFWLTALKNNAVVADEITDRDEGALKYLKDIRCCRTDEPQGFKLEFYFDPNPYFKNSGLTKTYQMIYEADPILEKTIGTVIEWLPGKCLTKKVLKKKPKKGSKNAKPITKTEDCESFFNFFNTPLTPEDEDDLDAIEELQDGMEQDYNIGTVIRDKIIPHAVSWFTGEAAEEDELDLEDDDDDDIGDEGDDDEDGDEGEDDKQKGRKKVQT